MKIALRAAGFACVVAAAATVHAATRVNEDVPIPGGTEALANALGLDGVPDRPRFLAEIARIVYESPAGKNVVVSAKQLRLRSHLEAIGRFQKALAAVQSGNAGITLAMASRKDERNRLKDFLEFVGLKLREKNTTLTVEASGSKEAVERVKQLAALGIELGSVPARLNAGEPVRIQVPSETIPVPLDAKTWSTAIFGRTVTPDELFAAITLDARAALLAHGLAALDDETLAYLAGNPEFLTRLYEDHASAVAAFGDTIRIHSNRVVPPGGAEGIRIWEAVLGETVSRPDRFVRVLLGQAEGRIALVYEALTYLDAPHVRFAYGASIADATRRIDQFKMLLDHARDRSEWHVADAPFARPVYDVATLLARVRVRSDGAPAPPSARVFWHQVFDGVSIPDDPARRLRNLHEDGDITAGWLAEAVASESRAIRVERFDQLSFGQRAFAGSTEAQLPDALVAVRSLSRFRMLMLTIERIGVRDPRVYADAARRAYQIAELDNRRRVTALGAFQGGVALVGRLAKVRTIAPPVAEALLTSLFALPLDEHGRYAGGLHRWVTVDVAAAGRWRADAEIDREIARAAAGIPDSSPTKVTWEGRIYRVDLVTPERSRVERSLEKMRAPSIRTALELSEIAGRMSVASPSLEDIEAASAQLKAVLTTIPKPEKGEMPQRPGVESAPPPNDVIGRVAQALSKITQAKDSRKAASAAAPLATLSDEWLADALMSFAYAFDLGNPDGTVLMGGDPSRRHDFGFDARDDEERLRLPWTAPRAVSDAAMPWHVRGSVLGLDVSLAQLALRRIDSGEVPPAPTLPRPDYETFVRSAALINPFDLRDSDRDVIVAQIERGRARVAAATTPELWERIAVDARLDGWRRRSGEWMIAGDAARVPTLFSLAELYVLGGPAADLPIERWGTSAEMSDGCLCQKAPAPGQWLLAKGRSPIGELAGQVADIHLLIAERLRARGLPARLARGVLAAALQDYVDAVRPLHADDWLTEVRAAQAITDDRIDDYVAALTAGGPLVVDRGASTGGQR